MNVNAMDSKSLSLDEKGATVVEFSIALIFLFVFLLIFFQISMIFLAHERVTYASYIAARVGSVGGNVDRAINMVHGKISIKKYDPITKKWRFIAGEYVELNKAFQSLLKKRSDRFLITQEFDIPREEMASGDNR